MEYLNGDREREAIRWMQNAARVAAKALCLKAKCGSIIVKDGAIIGQGYNAPPLDREEYRTCNKEFNLGKPKYDRTCCIHAEWRAILDALRRSQDKIAGSTIYFTRVDDEGQMKKSRKPYCTVCSRLALDAGIKAFVLWHDEGLCEYTTGEFDRLSYAYVHIE